MSRSARRAKNLSEADWRLRLQNAQTHYWQALDRHQQAMEELNRCLDNGANGQYEKARAKHDVAFDELLTLQKILTALVLRMEMPQA